MIDTGPFPLSKLCSRCQTEKKVGDFYLVRHGKEIYGHCLSCCKEVGRERYQRRREVELAKAKAWSKNNRARANAAWKRRTARDPSEHRRRAREWAKANPEEYRRIQSRADLRRRARELDAFVEDVDRDVLYQRDEGICGVCGEVVDYSDFHVDHIVPLSKGGEHSYANCQVAHPHCNRVKGASLSRVEDPAEKGEVLCTVES